MRVAGVVVEYNPLHNGHLYHLQETQKKVEPDLTIAVMSGDFLQRGEPALLSKWTRTQLALEAGVDLVIELPYAYATQKAPVFAWGAVSLLDDLGVTDLCFGSENGRIEPFIQTYKELESRHEDYQSALRDYIQQGYSYPKAQSLAFQNLYLNKEETIDLSQPNNILGYQYLVAQKKLHSKMTVHTIKRTGAGYHDANVSHDRIASATAIRNQLFATQGNWPALDQVVPPYTAAALREALETREIRSWDDYFPFLRYRLMTDSIENLGTIYEAEEGLEHRLKNALTTTHSFSDFMNQIKTKRYTWTRLQRLLTHILTQTTKDDLLGAANGLRPDYIRLLGMSDIGQAYLNKIKNGLRIPLVARLGKDRHKNLERDIQAAMCYDLLHPNSKREFVQPPIRFVKAD